MTYIFQVFHTAAGRATALLVAVLLLGVPSTTSAGQRHRGGASGGGQAAPRGGSATPSTSPGPSGQSGSNVAVPRGSAPQGTRGGVRTVYVPGYYGGYWPWAFGGVGFGYYGGLYDPFYPWYSGYDGYGYDYGYGYGPSVATSGPDGSLRVKVTPHDAHVYVDGFYAGIVDDFNGAFERLHVQPGPHHIEVRAPGYDTLAVDVMIRPGQTMTLARELERAQ